MEVCESLSARLVQFLNDVAEFKLKQDANNVTGISVDGCSLYFSLSVDNDNEGASLVKCSIIASEHDYPGGTVITLNDDDLQFVDATVDEAFGRILKVLNCMMDSGHVSDSGDHVSDSDDDVSDIDTDEHVNEADPCLMEKDELAVQEFATARLELGNKFCEFHCLFIVPALFHFPGLECLSISLKINYDAILSEITMEAWGLPKNNQIRIALEEVYVKEYRLGIKVPQVKVSLFKNTAGKKPPGILEQIQRISRNYVRTHFKIEETDLITNSCPIANFIVGLYDYVGSRLNHLNEHCIICDERFDTSNYLMMPCVCYRRLCAYAFEDLGVMAEVGMKLVDRKVIDLLLAMLNQAAIKQPISPFPPIYDPAAPTQMLLDPDHPDNDLLGEIVASFPVGDTLLQLLGNEEALHEIHHLAWPVIQWTISSNRAYIVSIPEELQLDFMHTQHQFLMLTDSPAKETAFRAAKAASPEKVQFVFHGSPAFNWHSIVRQGLIVASNTNRQLHGAAHGRGIYVSPSSAVSATYSYSSNGNRRDRRNKQSLVGIRKGVQEPYLMDSDDMTCIAICEVVGETMKAHSSQIWTLQNPEHCCTRFLFAYSSGVMDGDISLTLEDNVQKLKAALDHFNIP